MQSWSMQSRRHGGWCEVQQGHASAACEAALVGHHIVGWPVTCDVAAESGPHGAVGVQDMADTSVS